MHDEIDFYFDLLADDYCEGIDDNGQFIISKKGQFGAEFTESSASNNELSDSSPSPGLKKSVENGPKYRVGRWSSEEHNKFLEALRIYGKDWDSMQKYVGTRDSPHIRSHAQKFFRKLVKVINVKLKQEQ